MLQYVKKAVIVVVMHKQYKHCRMQHLVSLNLLGISDITGDKSLQYALRYNIFVLVVDVVCNEE